MAGEAKSQDSWWGWLCNGRDGSVKGHQSGDRLARVYLAAPTQHRKGSPYAARDAMKPCRAMTPAPRDQASLEPSESVMRID